METYQQIHDFTPSGSARFEAFLNAHARKDASSVEACRMECLGVIEDNLNSGLAGPLAWELGRDESLTGQTVIFVAEPGDLIIESVNPAE